MRAKEKRSWRSRGILTRPSGTSTFDTATGTETSDPSTQIYSGKCQIRAAKWVGRDAQAGQEEVRISTLRCKLPADTPVEIDDELEITETDYDADLVGRTFRVSDVLRDDWQVARVVMIEEVT